MRDNLPKVSVDVITSALNEEDCLQELFRRLENVFKNEQSYNFRTIIMDNGSYDKTWQMISQKANEAKNFCGIKLSRTFSLDSAFTCGLDYATSEIAILMTSDLQDPPELIHELLRKYEDGYDQVLVRITKRNSVPLIRRVFSWLFYALANKLTSGILPKSVSDFRLMSRKTYKSVSLLRENHRFMRGIGSWVGFKTAVIDSERPPRFAGESKWLNTSIVRVVSDATKSILAYSSRPLSWLSAIGILSSLVTSISLVSLLAFWLTGGGRPFEGFASIIVLILVLFSILMLSIGIIAQYLSLMYEELKSRPLYIIDETAGYLQVH
jgi:dolichol-phosphate mannosyltransferase